MQFKKDSWIYKTSLFLASQGISLFGSSVVAYAVIWYITLETQSATMLTAATVCSFIPQILISLFAGVWADRYNRRYIIILADLFTALVTLIIAIMMISGYKSFIIIFIMSGLRSLGMGLQMPAVGALLPQIVPVEKLTRINGINMTINSVMMLVSPALGGLLLSTIGFSYTLLVDVITAAIAIAIMFSLRIAKHELKEEPGSALKELIKGIKYTRSHPLVSRLLVMFTLFFFLVTPAAFLTPILVARSFGPEVWLLTANEIAWTFGTIVGGILISVWQGFKNRFFTMAFSAFMFGVCFALMGIAGQFYLYLLIVAVSGIFMPLFHTTETVIIQESVEENMMGRVFSVIQIIISATMPLGMLVFGPLGDMIPIESLLIGTGLIMAILAPLILKAQPKNQTPASITE